ncbi:MAG: transposase [Desulfovibrionaceae bacterium]|nr:transposase [Desulfovibrionaceae bacterium]
MKRSRFSEARIIGSPRQARIGVRVADLRRQNGISDATFCAWRAQLGGMAVSYAKRLRPSCSLLCAAAGRHSRRNLSARCASASSSPGRCHTMRVSARNQVHWRLA